MIMTDSIAREVIRERTHQAGARRRPQRPRTVRALRGLADRLDRRA